MGAIVQRRWSKGKGIVRSRHGTAELDFSPNFLTETCPESQLVAEIA